MHKDNNRLLKKVALGATLLFALVDAAYAVNEGSPCDAYGCMTVAKRYPLPFGSYAQYCSGPGCSAAIPSLHNIQDGGAGSVPATTVPEAPRPEAPPSSNNNTQKTTCAGATDSGGNSNPISGHPVIIATGEKVKDETDFQGAGLYPVGLVRHYHGFSTRTGSMFGSKWASSYDYHLTPIGSDCMSPPPLEGPACYPHSFQLDTPDGSFSYTKTASKAIRGPFRVSGSDKLGALYVDDTGLYTVTLGSTTFDFDWSGNILDLADASGASLTFLHSGSNITQVTGAGNQIIKFTWSSGHVTQVTDPRGQVWGYGYTPGGMLQTVTSPDSHITTYGYDASHTNWLNSINVDGAQVLAVTYFTNGKVATSGTPDGEEVDSFTYGTGSTTLTNQRGDATTYGFQSVQGALKLSSVSHAGTSTCPAMAASTAYDANGWVDYTVDWRGIKTDYTYAADGRLLDKTVGYGTATPLKDLYTWMTISNGQFMLQSVASYGTNGQLFRTTSYAYDPSTGYPSSVSVKDASTGVVATTNYGYTFTAGLLRSRSETRKLPAGDATTTYNYDGAGNLSSFVDASGATMTFSGYDGLGRPSSMVEANGASHSFTYDGRGNTATSTAYLPNGNATSGYSYDGRNILTSITYPDGGTRHFTITQSGRVASATDVAGLSASETFTNAATLVDSRYRYAASVSGSSVTSSLAGIVSETHQLDSLGREIGTTGNNSQNFSYGYDANSNVTSVSDGVHTTRNNYDSLNRVSVTTLPDLSTITYGYAPSGMLSSVSTNRGAQTTYTTNGFGFVTQRSSPDTGVTTYTVDPYGRVTQEVRSNGTTVVYGYDGLDRLTSRTSSGNTETYTYASSGANATRLTGISNPTSSSTYNYDGYGHVDSQSDVIAGQSFGTSYAYNAAGQLTGMTYPDGLSLIYSYNSAGQVVGVTPSRSGGAVASAVYQPFGATPYAWAFGNGSTMVGGVDLDGRLVSLNSVFTKSFSYNVDNTIAGISDSAYPDVNETFTYNGQSRLTATSRASDPQNFGIDSDGNRTSISRAGNTTSYPIAGNSNKVTSWSYMGGDIYADGVRTYTRDEFDRLAAVTKAGQTVGQYRYDALDRRVYKSTSQGVIYFTYAPSGQLLYEQSAQRTVDYVWLAGQLVGISINHGSLQSVHTDWLGRPELVTGSSSPTVTWRASNAVYDRKVTLDNIGGLNVFFPGQYYDAESDLYYNWHRYSDPNMGRYIQSDPIGLAGGLNTYAYAGSNPVSNVDFTGLSFASTVNDLTGGCSSNTAMQDIIDNYHSVQDDTSIAKTIGGLALGGSAAKTYGGLTLLQAGGQMLRDSRAGFVITGVGSRTFGQAAAMMGATWAVNSIALKGAYDLGVLAGSAIRTGINRATAGAACCPK